MRLSEVIQRSSITLISPGLAHFQALPTVSTPATFLKICNIEMYNDNYI